MDTSQMLVTFSGMAIVLLIAWYFFLSEGQAVKAKPADGGIQQVRIVVKGGYDPDTVIVEEGRPVRLDFYRDETSSCSDTVVFGDFGIARPLPAHQTTPVEFTPGKTGEFTFTCGMNMMRGKLVVKAKKT